MFGVSSAVSSVRRESNGDLLSAAYRLAPPGASDDGVGNGVERRVFQDIHR